MKQVWTLVALIALGMSAMAQDNARPPKKGMIWWPSSGTVILAGGGFTQDGAEAFVDRIIKLAGGPEALIVVIPTASVAVAELPVSGPQPPNVDATRRILESKGAKNIAFLHTRDRKCQLGGLCEDSADCESSFFYWWGRPRAR